MTGRILLIVTLFLSFNAISQREHFTGLYLGFGKTNSITADVVKNFKLLKSEKLYIGPGVRAGFIYTSKNISFYTAPAKHSKESSAIDTLIVNKPWSIPVNINFNVSYLLNKKLSLGVNLDIVGITLGSKQNGSYFPSIKQQETKGARTVLNDESVKPMINNFNMIGNYRKGTTINEVFARYNLNERFSAKLGYIIITSEFITKSRIGYKSNYRYRNTSSQFCIGVSYHFI